jgi:hypothetical protein
MFPWDPFDPKDGSEARLKSFRIYWGVTASTSGIIFIVLLLFIADDLENGFLKTQIMRIRPGWSIFQKRKDAKQKRQDLQKKGGGQISTAIPNGSANGVTSRGGYLRHSFLRTRRNQDGRSLA